MIIKKVPPPMQEPNLSQPIENSERELELQTKKQLESYLADIQRLREEAYGIYQKLTVKGTVEDVSFKASNAKHVPPERINEATEYSSTIIKQKIKNEMAVTEGGSAKRISTNVANLEIDAASDVDNTKDIENILTDILKDIAGVNIETNVDSGSHVERVFINIGNKFTISKAAPTTVGKLPSLWNVPPKNDDFVSRHILNRIEEHLQGDNNHSQTCLLTACYGLGGMGKTQAAVAFVREKERYKNYQGVCWFNAETIEKLISEYMRLGQALSLFCEEKCVPVERALRVKNQLENKCQDWLLIYDDAPRYEEIRDWLPKKGGKILITSRHEGWPSENSLSVDVFSGEEATNYVSKIIGASKALQEREAVQQFITHVGRLPLALAQACAYIRKNKDKTVTDYLARYERSRSALLADKLLPTEKHQAAVAVTWHITLEQMRTEAPDSVEFLYSYNHLQHADLPTLLIQHLPVLGGKNEAAEAAQNLAKEYSIIIVDEIKNTFSVHPIVQEVMRRQLKSQEVIYYLSQACMALKAIHLSATQIQDYASKRLLQPYLKITLAALDETVEEVLREEKKAALFNNNNNNTYNAGKNKATSAKNLINQKNSSIKLEKNDLKRRGNVKEILLLVLELLAATYETLGDVYLQKPLLDRAVAIKEALYGKEHPEVAITLFNLGVCYFQQGALIEALFVIQRIYDIYLHHPNDVESSSRIYKVKQFLNKILLSLGKEGEPIYFLHRYENYLELDSASSDSCLVLAGYYFKQYNLIQAIACYEKVLTFTSANGDVHHNLAWLYHVKREYSKAEQHFKEALKCQSRASYYCDYGFFLHKQNRWEEAIAQFKTAILCQDDSRLMYEKLVLSLMDEYLQQAIIKEKTLKISPILMAHYWLIHCSLNLNDVNLKQHHLTALTTLIASQPTSFHYCLLSCIYRYLEDNKSDEEESANENLMTSKQAASHDNLVTFPTRSNNKEQENKSPSLPLLYYQPSGLRKAPSLLLFNPSPMPFSIPRTHDVLSPASAISPGKKK